MPGVAVRNLPQRALNRNNDVLAQTHYRRRFSAGDVRQVGRVSRIHGPLLQLLQIEITHRRANGDRLERYEHGEVMRLAESGCWRR